MQRHHATPASIGDISQSQGSEHAIHITHLAHSKPNGNATLLAQIPDMSFDEPDSFLEERAAAGDGRIISQALAGKLVISGGILLVLAAILPFVAPAEEIGLDVGERTSRHGPTRRPRMPPLRRPGTAAHRKRRRRRSPPRRRRPRSSSRRRPRGPGAMRSRLPQAR